jgi:hypothetical protein
MRHLAKVNLAIVLAASLAFAGAAKKEYLTEDELDMIRDAQELSARVQTYFKLAERRLIFLGIMERSPQQIEKERKDREKREKEQKKSPDSRATSNKAPVDETAYLDDFTPAELLRGYIQILDEVTDNIDSAYSSKLDVRDALEDLSKFVHDSSAALEKFKAKTNAERSALQDAFDKAKQVAADTKEALSIVPKTEKKRK